MKKCTVLEIIFHIEDKIREYHTEYLDTDKSYSLIRGSLSLQIRTLEELLNDIKKRKATDEATKHIMKKF